MALLLLLAGCGDSFLPGVLSGTSGTPTVPLAAKYDVTVTRTAYGIPHIKAADYGSLGYGYGYAQAEDNVCVVLEELLTNRGERSKYFGGNGRVLLIGNSGSASNIDSDFFWKLVATPEAIARVKNAALPGVQMLSSGYVDGFNRYIGELKAGRNPSAHARCRTAGWMQPITLDDLYRRYYRLSLLASTSVFISGVAQAQPPVAGNSATAMTKATMPSLADLRADPGELAFFTDKANPFGSNMLAIGPDFSESGKPIQLVNPHFPWTGSERLYLSHLTLPGKLDIMGSSLYGVPVVLIGFNQHLAWSHTVSFSYRFTLYELTLAPGDPTSYVQDGKTIKMKAVPLSIEVKQDDGSVTRQTRTLYLSHYGPIMGLVAGGANILPWSTSKAYTLRDANAENDRLMNQFFSWDHAKSLNEFKALHKSILGVPWVNTTASSPDNPVYYGDVTVVPNVPDAKVTACSTSVQAQALSQLAPGLPLLDGSQKSCDWDTDADAPAPGIFGPKNLPTLERRDYVANNNDSYWLTNPKQPITGFAKILGPVNSARNLRTRHGLIKMQQREAGTDGFPGTKWTPERLMEAVLDSHIYTADLGLPKVLADYCGQTTAVGSSGTVDISKECAALRTWDRSNSLDSKGGHLWREFYRTASTLNGFYLTPFSTADPINTPNNINTQSPQVRQVFADTVKDFQSVGIAANATLGSIQKSSLSGVPVFGGLGNLDGAFTIAQALKPTDAQGYKVDYGNSHVAVITWDANGNPDAHGYITYSQSTDPANPHFQDFSEAYSRKLWPKLPFTADEIQLGKLSELHLHE